ncbi:Tim44/TimA family putative adaptor protein [Sphingomonas sp. RHCKR47]|uniref:Tim44/TimA family putative adaptor protein n=1 Tax=Sphingomonas citricola TaxID=2862498 RepID=UPI001CA558CB|nr:Tim44/TimA family putative adaptor protein [Sphingomonas citricola]MBW6523702.1 Tim44/TimA family putative adaptor protein [Sphingomonas citricola]
MFYVVLLAIVAAFLALRLYSVLGKRGGHEQSLPRAAEERVAAVAPARTVDNVPDVRGQTVRPFDNGAEAGLRAVAAAEPGFDVSRFVDGSQAAYRMILEAFWRGDEDALAELVVPDVRQAFVEAMEARRDAGHVLDNRLVTIECATIVSASVEGRQAQIAVRFDADIAAVTRDTEGNLVAGSLSDAVQTHDVWTFTRTLKSADPNWMLADTDEA